ncbi:MAG: ANTAR domain-containing response regulator [Micrococcales bacterium]
MAEQSQSRRVLVAEDEALIRMDVVESLRELGYEVIAEAADGEEAVKLAKEYAPDICIMDVKMPKLDGISAAEQIATLKIPVVLLTAFNQKELVTRASEAGAMAYIVKPFDPNNDLLPAIEIALSRHAQLTILESEIADLTERFETRKVIDRAKGLLNEKMNLTEPEAFRWIQKASMDRRLTMLEVAKTIIDQLGTAKPSA